MVATLKTEPPPGILLGPLSRRVLDVLAAHTAFPWPVLRTQAQRAGVDPTQLTVETLAPLLPMLVQGVGRFTSPEKEAQVRAGLSALLT